MKRHLLNRNSILLIGFAVVLLDQISKSFARYQLSDGITQTLIPILLD